MRRCEDKEFEMIHAYDRLIVEHGYTHESLLTKYQSLSQRHSETYVRDYFNELLRDAQQEDIHLERGTSAIDELSKYYGFGLAKCVVSEIECSRRKSEAIRMRKKAA